MSLRWARLKQLLRPHALDNAALGASSSSTSAMLQRLCWFQETYPLDKESQLPATLKVFVQQTSLKQSSTSSMPTATWECKMALWNAVLPWETARGLSNTPPRALVAEPLLDFVDGKRSSRPTTSELAAVGEVGMLFLHNASLNSSSSPPPSFWSGAITTPIDICFIQRTDPYAGVRSNIRKALGQFAKSSESNAKFGKDSLRGDGMELVIADYHKLEPFEACDQTKSTPLAQLYPDLYPPHGAAGGGKNDQQRATEATSRARNIHLVLEARRGVLRDHITQAVSHAPRVAEDKSQSNVIMMLQLSEEMHDEIIEKRQLMSTMVTSLEDAVRLDIVRASQAELNEEVEEGEASDPDVDVAANEKVNRQGNYRSRDPAARGEHEDPNAVLTTSTLTGRQSIQTIAAGNSSGPTDTSARRASRYPKSDPSFAQLPTLNYPLLVQAFKLSLCAGEIMSLGSRMVHEIQRGVVDQNDIAWLLHLAEDASLSIPDELANAIRTSARRMGVKEKAVV